MKNDCIDFADTVEFLGRDSAIELSGIHWEISIEGSKAMTKVIVGFIGFVIVEIFASHCATEFSFTIFLDQNLYVGPEK